MRWKGKKCLVTGGAGFIGSHIVESLVNKGAKVTVIDNLSTGFKKNICSFESDIDFIQGSILDDKIMDNALKNIEYVFHLAALPSVTQSIIDPINTAEVNVIGTLKLLEYSRRARVKKLIFSSSCAIYGDNSKLLSEKEIPKPMSPYAFQKLMSENFCRMYNSIYGLQTIALRYFNVYGPRQDLSSEYSAVLPTFIDSISNGISPIIYGDGRQSRDFVFVSDIVQANLKAAFSLKAVATEINVASGSSATIKELAKNIMEFFDKDLEFNYRDSRKGDIRHSLANISKARKLIEYAPKYDLSAGISEVANYLSKFKNK